MSLARSSESSFMPLPRPRFVDVGGVEAGGGEDVGVHGGAEGEMAADADAHGAEFAGAVGAGGEVVEDGAGVGVVGWRRACRS